VLKSEAVYLWAKIFKAHGIEVFQDVSMTLSTAIVSHIASAELST